MTPAYHMDASITVEEKRDLTQRIALSGRFQRSPRLRDFFVYICEESLAGRADTVHEQQIGVRVFGRRPDYSPGEDNIVRAEARRLRKELEAYFLEDGREENIVLSIPKGSYVPAFARLAAISVPEPEPAKAGGSSVWLAISGAGVLAIAALLIWWVAGTARPASPPPPVSAIWPQLLDLRSRTNVVLADASFSLLQDMLGHEIAFSEYEDRSYAKRLKDPRLLLLTERHYAGLAGIMILTKILQSEGCPRDKIAVRHARNLTIRDFQTENHILLGSRFSNPWVELFADRRNFRAEFDWQNRIPFYRNRAPRTGEQEQYVGNQKGGEQYSLVTYLPNLTQTGSILIIEGTTAEGTEGALEFIFNHRSFAEFWNYRQPSTPGGPTRYFEVLLRTRAMGKAPVSTTYVTHRDIPVQ